MGYKTERLELRLTEREIQILDEVRGSATRSAWIRSQITRGAPPVAEEPDRTTVTLHDGTVVAEHPSHIETDSFVPDYVGTVSPNPSAVDPAGHVNVPAPPDRHLHRYVQKEHTGYRQGRSVHRWACACGAEKVE